MTRSFPAYLAAAFVNAFNDNAFKVLLLLIVLREVPLGGGGVGLVALTTAVFTAPFILFSSAAGTVADRYSKRTVFVGMQGAGLATMLLATAAFHTRSVPLGIASLFAAGLQSTFYSPAKYGILPEALARRDLSRANGFVESATFVAIVLGTAYGGVGLRLAGGDATLASAALVVLAALGLVFSFRVWRVPPSRPSARLSWNPFGEVAANAVRYLRDARLGPALAGLVFFYFLASTVQMAVLLHAKQTLFAGLSEAGAAAEGGTGVLLAVLALGIGGGALAAGRLSAGRVEVGLVPIGFLGAAAGIAAVGHVASPVVAGAALFATGFFGGFIAVPLLAAVQAWAPQDEKGAALAASNFLSFVGVLTSSGIFFALGEAGVSMRRVFFLLAGATVALGVWLCLWLREFVVRVVAWVLVHTVYRIRVLGAEHVPERGGAVLVANHVSFVDAILIGASISRPVRFLMLRSYFDRPAFRWFCRMMRAIPIRPGDKSDVARALSEATEAARGGELVCVFPEGAITRDGVMSPFRRGFERIARDAGVPVVPVYLDEVWGSVFSFRGGAPLAKLPRRLPYPVTVAYGAPLPPDVTAARAQTAVAEAGACAFEARVAAKGGLGRGLVEAARRRRGALAVADSFGTELSFARLAAVAAALARVIAREFPGPYVGIVLPPSAGGALVNVAAVFAGKVPVNLNFTASREALALSAARCGIRRVISSRKFLEKVDLAAAGLEVVEAEEIRSKVSRAHVAGYELAVRFLPSFLARRVLLLEDPPPDRTATVLFSSGSTGVPKGVVLTHGNVRADVEGVAEVLEAAPSDRLIGALPFFHAFGFTATLWFPLIAGFAALYHPNPLEARRIGELAKKYGATILLTTPTFAASYLRRIDAESFAKLRFTFVGAEALPPDLAEAWEEKYGSPMLEGYGATECAPVVSVNLPGRRKLGSIGHPLPGVAVRLVDPETGEVRDPVEGGILEVKGANVMRGYLDDPAEVLRDGWYRTGDVVEADSDGALRIVGRLSRFSKIGGEMVPHERVEKALREALGGVESEGAPLVVVGGKDEGGGERLVVLHTVELDPKALAAALREKGLPNLWIPKEYRRVEKIPLLGTGKVDLAACRRWVDG